MIESLVSKALRTASRGRSRCGELKIQRKNRRRHVNGLTENSTSQEADETRRHYICYWGGAALVLFGAGLILSTPLARRYLSSG